MSSSTNTRIVYIASAITNASEKHLRFLRNFKIDLHKRTAALILQWKDRGDEQIDDKFYSDNLRNVQICNVMIALISEPSIGVGIEIAESMRMKKPVLCLARENTLISRLILSAERLDALTVKRYVSYDEAVDIAADFIAKH